MHCISQVELEAERGWSVPVCVHKDVKKWTLTTDVSTWLNAKFSRRPSDDIVANPEQPQLGRLTCTFMVSLADEGFEWSEEIVVGLPVIPLLVTPSGELKSIDHTAIPTTSGATRRTSEYPSASSVTMRRRLLIRHKRYQHKMLTFTMTQVGLAVHISFFIDHQPPVIFLNQWKQMVGFRNVSAPSKPEGVSPNFYMEYDWTLQVRSDNLYSLGSFAILMVVCYCHSRRLATTQRSKNRISGRAMMTQWSNGSMIRFIRRKLWVVRR